MEMRGFKQILHLSRSIRLKLCNQAHVPLLLKQQLFGEEPFQGATVPFLIIYLKATFRLFYLCSLLVCCSCLQEYSTLFILMRDYLTKRWVSSFLLRCVLAVLFTIPYPVCVCVFICVCARTFACVCNAAWVTGARHHLLKGVVFCPRVLNTGYLFGMGGRQSARLLHACHFKAIYQEQSPTLRCIAQFVPAMCILIFSRKTRCMINTFFKRVRKRSEQTTRFLSEIDGLKYKNCLFYCIY